MPLYEYHCPSCDANAELLIRNADEKPVCPTCGGRKLEKLLSVPAGHVAGGSTDLPVMQGGCARPGCGPGGCGRM